MDLDAETDEDADKKTEENEASYEEALGLLNGYVEEELKYIKVSRILWLQLILIVRSRRIFSLAVSVKAASPHCYGC